MPPRPVRASIYASAIQRPAGSHPQSPILSVPHRDSSPIAIHLYTTHGPAGASEHCTLAARQMELCRARVARAK